MRHKGTAKVPVARARGKKTSSFVLIGNNLGTGKS